MRRVDVVLGDVVPAERAASGRRDVDRTSLELFGVGVEVDDRHSRGDGTIEVVVLVDPEPVLHRAVDGDAAEVRVLDHQRCTDPHGVPS
jgi:hypothetical protein